MRKLIFNSYVSLLHELKKLEMYLLVNLLGVGTRLIKKEFTVRDLTKVEKHRTRRMRMFNFGFRSLYPAVNSMYPLENTLVRK